MKKLLLLLLPFVGFSQDRAAAEFKVHQGIELHDQGKYQEAVLKYDEALALDKNNLLAFSEKAMTLNAAKQFDEAINVCRTAIELNPKGDLKHLYVSLANSLDQANNPKEALKIYDSALKRYPDYHPLHYNRGITLVNLNKIEQGTKSFEQATKCFPEHSSSYNALAVLSNGNRVASILASAKYLTTDNTSPRAKANLEAILKHMAHGVTQTGENSVSLVLSADFDKKGGENNFSSTDLLLSMAAATGFSDENKQKTQCVQFIDTFEMICSSLKETKKKQKGYYWEFLAPYFIEMETRNLIEPFAYIAFLPTQTEDVLTYHKENSDKIRLFYEWSKNYKWNE